MWMCVDASELKCRSIQSHFPRQAFGWCIVSDPFGKLNGILLPFTVHANNFPQSLSIASLFYRAHNTRSNQFAISCETLCILCFDAIVYSHSLFSFYSVRYYCVLECIFVVFFAIFPFIGSQYVLYWMLFSVDLVQVLCL